MGPNRARVPAAEKASTTSTPKAMLSNMQRLTDVKMYTQKRKHLNTRCNKSRTPNVRNATVLRTLVHINSPTHNALSSPRSAVSTWPLQMLARRPQAAAADLGAVPALTCALSRGYTWRRQLPACPPVCLAVLLLLPAACSPVCLAVLLPACCCCLLPAVCCLLLAAAR